MEDTLLMTDIEFIDTEVEGTEEQDSIMVTRRAIDQVLAIRDQNSVPEEYNLRLGTRSGGCSGMNYIIGFDSEVNENDKLIDMANMNIVIDRESLFYLMGVTLDYVDDEQGSGFIFNNPNNSHTCGCGGHGH